MKKRLLTSIIALASVITLASCADTTTDPITGPTGPAGQNGQNGADGLNGVDGATWLFGSSDPSADLGAIGDLYLNTDTYDIYAKTESGWTLIGNIKGEDGLPGTDGNDGSDGLDGVDGTDGKDGATWLVGSTDPEDTIGEVGDLYLNDVTGDIFTKDESNNWRYIGNLKGDKGDTGEKGDEGLTAYSNTILPSENGYVLPSIGSALAGQAVTFTLIADEGYSPSSLVVNNIDVTDNIVYADGVYSYEATMVKGGFIVQATFALNTTSDYFIDGVLYRGGVYDALGNRIIDGVASEISFTSGTGTQADPLIASNANELAQISKLTSGDVYIQLADSIEEPLVLAETITVASDVNLNLDLNGKTITLANKSSQRGTQNYVFDISGTFTLDDVTATSDNPAGTGVIQGGRGCISCSANSKVTINAGTLTDISRSGGSAIYVDPTAKLEVNYVEVYCSNFAIGAQTSEVIINDGLFVSVSNNQIRDESGASTFTYCVNVGDGSIINGGTTIGIQGGTSLNNGSVIINEGYTSTVDADLAKTLYAAKLEEINETHPYTADELARITDSISFYALYIAGETELNPVVTINGGYYYSCYRSAALIGNSNDGGVGSSATCTINGGTFETDGTLAAISIDSSNPDYGLGFVRIYGGYYTDSQAMRDNLDKVLTADYTYKAIEADGLLSVIPA